MKRLNQVRIFKHIALICFLFPFYNSYAQTDSSYLNAEEVLEDLLQEPTNEEDDSNLYELIEQLLLNPIDINTAEVSELQQIPAIDLETAILIVNHRKKYGKFFSVNELNAVRDLSNEFVNKIKPYLTSSRTKDVVEIDRKDGGTISPIFSKVKILLRSRVSNDLQTRRGFIENRFDMSNPEYACFSIPLKTKFRNGHKGLSRSIQFRMNHGVPIIPGTTVTVVN
ncbi:MAG: helix-hairpin-helix domain-containing protein [Bacteroidetes bacterium]|nr:helix-hairpin-helix domain-containing protein [Bacteroidota bacterium]